MTPDSNAVIEGMSMLLDQRGIALYQVGGNSSIFPEFLPAHAEHALSLTIYASMPDFIGSDVTWPRVQFRARGDRNSPRWSRELLDKVFGVFHGFYGALPNGVWLAACYCLGTSPDSLGPDSAGRFEHVLNFQLWVCNAVPLEAVAHAST